MREALLAFFAHYETAAKTTVDIKKLCGMHPVDGQP